MEELLNFLRLYGWQLALIALAGIIILGVLKYCNVFSKFDKKIRHVFYLLISVGISIIGSIIYLACAGSLTVEFAFAVAAAILALNQTFYAIYSCTDLKTLIAKLIDWVKGLVTSGKGQEIVEEITDGKTEEETTEEAPAEDTQETTEK